jgi:prepilin-type N-terminal cleavage/methylation domain-containing protein
MTQRRHGFSMIEVLAAVAIFGVGLAALFTAFGSVAAQLEHQRHLTDGIHLTEAKLEETLLWSSSDAELTIGGSFGPEWYGPDGMPATGCPTTKTGLPVSTTTCRYRVTWGATAGGVEKVRVVTVTTAWNERGVAHTVSFSTQRN